jgi:hypothetical protein
MRLKPGTILLAILLAAPRPALAQQSGPRTLDVPATSSWQHAATQMTLPPRVGGLVRLHVRDNTQGEQDVVTTYIDREERMVALVYIYQIGAGDVPLWFDRTLATILLPQTAPTPPAITGFTRPGASVATGLRAAMSDNVPGMTTTAVAIAPLGSSWLIKIRMGSPQLDQAALNERLSAFVAALRWPAETGAARVAVPIEPCPTPLRFRNARIIRTETADVLMDAIIGSVEPEGEPGLPYVYCREPGATVERGVYRPGTSTESYLIALSDGGIAVSAGDVSGLSALLGDGPRSRFAVTLFGRNITNSYPSFNRLPTPEQALALVNGVQPLSATTGGSRGNR